MSCAPSIAKDRIYPNGDFLPGDGTQRGSIFTGNGGLLLICILIKFFNKNVIFYLSFIDPLTPEYPSTGILSQ